MTSRSCYLLWRGSVRVCSCAHLGDDSGRRRSAKQYRSNGKVCLGCICSLGSMAKIRTNLKVRPGQTTTEAYCVKAPQKPWPCTRNAVTSTSRAPTSASNIRVLRIPSSCYYLELPSIETPPSIYAAIYMAYRVFCMLT
jgi:hypothetical protein